MKVRIKILEKQGDGYLISCADQTFAVRDYYLGDENINRHLAYMSLKYVKNYDLLDALQDFDYEEDLETLFVFDNETVLNLKVEEITV
jgi:hypothetical protein